MYRCESWTITKTKRWRINCSELWCWRRLLRVPWTARRSNQSILKEIIPEYSLEGLMLKLKLQYFGYLIRRTDSFENTLMLGMIESGSRRGRQRKRWLDGITDATDMSLSRLQDWWWTERPGVLYSDMGSQRVGHDWVNELNWTEPRNYIINIYFKISLMMPVVEMIGFYLGFRMGSIYSCYKSYKLGHSTPL